MDSIILLDRVRRTFGDTVAAADVSCEVRRGEVFGLLGHNGAGKTTLIRLINGLLEVHAGRLETFGLDPVRDGHRVRQRTGVLTTYPGLDGYLSPSENIAVYASIQGLPRDVAHGRTVSLLTRLGIDPASPEPVRGLSAGLKQRVALARALVHEPELLLLDEPTANLDPVAARDVRRLVRELADEGRTVVFTTHNLAEAEDLCDRVAILQSGQMLNVGSLDQLASSGRLKGGVDLSVGADQVERAVRALGPHLNGHELTVRSDRIHVAGAGSQDVSVFVRLLVHADVDVQEARRVVPTLEDVYLSLHRFGRPS